MKHEKKTLPHQGKPPLADVTLGKAFTEVNKFLPGTDSQRTPTALYFQIEKIGGWGTVDLFLTFFLVYVVIQWS